MQDSSGIGFMQRQLDLEDDELSHAVSLSLQTAEQEKAMRELLLKDRDQLLGVCGLGIEAEKTDSSSRKLPAVFYIYTVFSLSLETHQSKRELKMCERNHLKVTCLIYAVLVIIPKAINTFYLLMSGVVFLPKSLTKQLGLRQNFLVTFHIALSMNLSYKVVRTQVWVQIPVQLPTRPSSSVMEKRLLREQQDDEYLASLLADREKEANALKESESLRLKEDDSHKKLLEEEKFERWLAVKETSLPPEPALEDENAVTLLVKMPDGSRRGRPFLKSDKLQFLFDFIDVGRVVKPGTYRVVRPYPSVCF
ncbi:hypothetical protein Patl1_00366 [Pistacia atlantica]|uniref:Uncharacterized protein n=1 Tax=Pistacia atlantica TaxID=434234 RepID=A0ACC1CBM2_9ROSI|nr:hypothetical protein Patl1_00366 [Pistacia atlantica]